MNLRLGRKPVRYDRFALERYRRIATHLAILGPAPAKSPDWVSAVMKQSPNGWGMFGNDQYGDCVFADDAHQEMLRTANVGTIWIPTTEEVLGLYSAVTGFNPNDPSTDHGANELDLIEYLTKTGWEGRKLEGHANLDPSQYDQLRWAVCLFGASRLGVNLPRSAMDQFTAGEPWDMAGDDAPVGGHDVPLVGYNGDTWFIVTWGKVQAVTQNWMDGIYPDGTPYVEEAHAELAKDWFDPQGVAPSHFNYPQLLADLKAVMSV